MGEHSIVGASAMARWQHCTASPSLIQTLPKDLQNRGSIFADEGSAAHRLCDLGVQHIMDLVRRGGDIREALTVNLLGTHIARYEDSDDFEVIGLNPFNGEQLAYEYEMLTGYRDHHFHCDVEMQEGVRFYLNHIIDIINECEGEVEIQPETRCYPLPGRENVFGTSDCVIIDLVGGRIWVIDFKFGRRLVYAPGNAQALFYATGSVVSVEEHLKDDMSVILMIIQPRVTFEDGRRISDAEYTVGDIKKWSEEVLEPAIIATQSPALAEYVEGDYCIYCPAAGICPLKDALALETARKAFSVAPETVSFEEIPELEMILPDPEDPEQLSKALKIGAALEIWHTRVQEMAEHFGVNGKPIPGFKVVRKTTRQRWKDTSEVLERLEKNGTMEQGVEVKPKTPAQMKASGALSEADLNELVEKPEGALMLAPESDRRKAVVSVAAHFSKAEK